MITTTTTTDWIMLYVLNIVRKYTRIIRRQHLKTYYVWRRRTRYRYEQYLHGRAFEKKLTGRRVNIHLCDIIKKENTLQLWDRRFRRNSSLQAVCDTPIARITSCLCDIVLFRHGGSSNIITPHEQPSPCKKKVFFFFHPQADGEK